MWQSDCSLTCSDPIVICVTISIETTLEEVMSNNDDQGSRIRKTGEQIFFSLWLLLGIIYAVQFILLVVYGHDSIVRQVSILFVGCFCIGSSIYFFRKAK